MYNQGGNWYLLVIYVVGCIYIVTNIIRFANFNPGWIEIICFSLVLVCIIAWQTNGASYATVISTLGVSIATIPVLKDAILIPEKTPVDVYIGFVGVNALATAGGKAWTLEERFYPSVCTILCFLVVLCASRKYFAPGAPRDV